ncbi:hypothetical protein C2S51_022137 [Perilla frutescens var. frutescens]|nr:hypothetical protein C2S51_022137 [Perilla frutescens var. frutescens]
MRLSLFLLSLLISASVEADHNPTVQRHSRARAFIELQCHKTLYPDLCIRYLSYYVTNFTNTLSHQKLAQIALKVSLDRAESTRAYVTDVAKDLKLNKANYYYYQAIRECLDQINDGVAQLSNCMRETQMIKENGGSDGHDFPWHASNVQTWMSAALTDASMCIIDGFSGRAIGGKTKALLKAKVLNLEQTTSISLALFNRFAARYKSSHDNKP